MKYTSPPYGAVSYLNMNGEGMKLKKFVEFWYSFLQPRAQYLIFLNLQFSRDKIGFLDLFMKWEGVTKS